MGSESSGGGSSVQASPVESKAMFYFVSGSCAPHSRLLLCVLSPASSWTKNTFIYNALANEKDLVKWFFQNFLVWLKLHWVAIFHKRFHSSLPSYTGHNEQDLSFFVFFWWLSVTILNTNLCMWYNPATHSRITWLELLSSHEMIPDFWAFHLLYVLSLLIRLILPLLLPPFFFLFLLLFLLLLAACLG